MARKKVLQIGTKNCAALAALIGTEAENATQAIFVLDFWAIFLSVCLCLCVRGRASERASERARSATVSCDLKSVFSGYTLTGDFVPFCPLLTQHKTNCVCKTKVTRMFCAS